MIKAILVAEVHDPAKAKANLPGMIDNARKFPGCVNFDCCEMLGDSGKFGLFAVFQDEDAFNKFKNDDKFKALKEKGKENYKGEWTVKTFKVVY